MTNTRIIKLTNKSSYDEIGKWTDEWSDFVFNHSEGSIFQTPEFFLANLGINGHEPISYLLVDSHEKIQAVVLVVLRRESKGLKGILSSRAIVIDGPLMTKESNAQLSFFLGIVRNDFKWKAIYIQFRNGIAQTSQRKSIFNSFQFEYEDHLNILVDLSMGLDSLWNEVSRSRKKGIKKARLHNYEFYESDSEETLTKFYELLSSTYRRIGLPYPKYVFFERIRAVLGSTHFRLFVLSSAGIPIIIMISLIYKDIMYGFYVGNRADEKHSKNKSSDLFYWEVFKWCSLNGIRTFNWMGAGKPGIDYGVRNFKLEFGGRLTNPGRYQRINNKLLFAVSKAGLKLSGFLSSKL